MSCQMKTECTRPRNLWPFLPRKNRLRLSSRKETKRERDKQHCMWRHPCVLNLAAPQPMRSWCREAPTSSGHQAAPQPFSRTPGRAARQVRTKRYSGNSNTTLEVQVPKCTSAISRALSSPRLLLSSCQKLSSSQATTNSLENPRGG